MTIPFYIAASVALLATIRAVTHAHIVHALLYFVVSLLAVAVIFFMFGAPFVAALEVIIYAGAILVLFLFVIMLLNFGESQARQERGWLGKRLWAGPGILCIVLLVTLGMVVRNGDAMVPTRQPISPREVGISLFGTYLIAVQLAALLLLSGLIGASHLRRHEHITPLMGEPLEPIDDPGKSKCD